jgi:hypothetical protein
MTETASRFTYERCLFKFSPPPPSPGTLLAGWLVSEHDAGSKGIKVLKGDGGMGGVKG